MLHRLCALWSWCAGSSSSSSSSLLYLSTEGCSVLSTIRNITTTTTNTLAAAAVDFSAPARSQSEAPRSPWREDEACQRHPCCTWKWAICCWFCWTPAFNPDLRLSKKKKKNHGEALKNLGILRVPFWQAENPCVTVYIEEHPLLYQLDGFLTCPRLRFRHLTKVRGDTAFTFTLLCCFLCGIFSPLCSLWATSILYFGEERLRLSDVADFCFAESLSWSARCTFFYFISFFIFKKLCPLSSWHCIPPSAALSY